MCLAKLLSCIKYETLVHLPHGFVRSQCRLLALCRSWLGMPRRPGTPYSGSKLPGMEVCSSLFHVINQRLQHFHFFV